MKYRRSHLSSNMVLSSATSEFTEGLPDTCPYLSLSLISCNLRSYASLAFSIAFIPDSKDDFSNSHCFSRFICKCDYCGCIELVAATGTSVRRATGPTEFVLPILSPTDPFFSIPPMCDLTHHAEIDPALEGVPPEMRVPALDPPPAAVLVGRLLLQVVCVRGKDCMLATPAAMQVPGRHPERVPRRFRRPHPETRLARHRRWRDLGR